MTSNPKTPLRLLIVERDFDDETTRSRPRAACRRGYSKILIMSTVLDLLQHGAHLHRRVKQPVSGSGSAVRRLTASTHPLEHIKPANIERSFKFTTSTSYQMSSGRFIRGEVDRQRRFRPDLAISRF